MTITFPAWYQGGYPTVDKVMVNLLQPRLNEIGPTVPTAVWQLPQQYSAQLPLVWCYRRPGGIDMTTRMDHAIGYLGVIAAVPDDDWDLYEYCRQILLAYRDGGTVTDPETGDIALIDSVEELEGPEQVQELDSMLRLTPGTFHITLSPPRDLPDYRQVLGIR